MQKISFEDYPSTNTPIDADNLNDLQDNVENAIEEVKTELKEYIVVTINNLQTITSNSKVEFDSIARSEGNFTLNNGEIVVGSGIHHVRVSAGIFVDNWSGGTNYLWGLLQLNNSNAATSINGGASSYLSVSIPSTIFSVLNGDKIKLVVDSPSGGTLRRYAENTWLCVEKVD